MEEKRREIIRRAVNADEKELKRIWHKLHCNTCKKATKLDVIKAFSKAVDDLKVENDVMASCLVSAVAGVVISELFEKEDQ